MLHPPAYSIIAAEFNKPLIDAMVAIAEAEFLAHNLTLARILRVPGCYELPLIAQHELNKKNVAGLILLGYIEKGETGHGETMANTVLPALMNLQLTTKKPLGIGIIGPGCTPEQAQVRHIHTAKAAVAALKRLTDLLH